MAHAKNGRYYPPEVYFPGMKCEAGTPVKATADGVEVECTLHQNLGTVESFVFPSVIVEMGQPNHNGDMFPNLPGGMPKGT